MKKPNIPVSTITYNREDIESPTNNIYKAISIIAKRSKQIHLDVKKELTEKLEEFATPNESLEEVFENKEQIAVSSYYERLPKPHSVALDEWLEGKIEYRDIEEE